MKHINRKTYQKKTEVYTIFTPQIAVSPVFIGVEKYCIGK